MQDCPLRKQLIREWCDALDQLSICVELLEGCASNPVMFDQQRWLVKLARIEADNACRSVNGDGSEYQCHRADKQMANVIPISMGRVPRLDGLHRV